MSSTQTKRNGPIPLLAITVDKLATQRIRAVRKLPADLRLRGAVEVLSDLVDANGQLEVARLELMSVLNVPVHHADQGRDNGNL